MENEKMVKMAGRIDRVCNVFGKLCIAGAVICAIFIPLCFIVGEKLVAEGVSVTLGSASISLKQAYAPEFSAIRPGIIVTLVSALLMACVYTWGLGVLRKILAPMKSGLPFDGEAPAQFRKLGWIVIIGSLIQSVLDQLSEFIMLRAFDLERLISGSAVESISYDFKFELGGVLIGILIIFFGYVFAYGAMLQQQADETL